MYENEPNPEVQKEIRRHLVERHGRLDFDLRLDVFFAGSAPEGALIVYLPETAARQAGYTCALCPGLIFLAGEPSYGHPARNAQLLRDHPELWAKTAGLSKEERAIVLEDFDRQSRSPNRGKGLLHDALRRKGRATMRARRPEVVQRIARCQEFLLDAWAELGTQELAIRALIDLARADPARHQRIVGRPYPMAYETYRDYLKQLAPEEREKIRARIRAGASASRRKLTR